MYIKDKMDKCRLITAVVAIIVIVCLFWWCSCNTEDRIESYTWANEIEELPALAQPSVQIQSQPSLDSFADMLDGPQEAVGDVLQAFGDDSELGGQLPLKAGNYYDPVDYLPDINSNVAMYDKDVADPQVFMFRPSVRTSIKNRQWAGADPIRGDLPIEKSPCYGQGWFNSRYGPGDNNLNGIMSPYFIAKYNALTGQQSLPVNVSNEETIMDYNQQPDRLAQIYENEGENSFLY